MIAHWIVWSGMRVDNNKHNHANPVSTVANKFRASRVMRRNAIMSSTAGLQPGRAIPVVRQGILMPTASHIHCTVRTTVHRICHNTPEE